MDLFPRVYCGKSKEKNIIYELFLSATNLGNSFTEYFFVGVFSDLPVVVCRLQDQLHLLHYSVLSLNFFQKLKTEITLETKQTNEKLTFSFTAISTAEFGTSSIIFNLSSTTFILTFFFDAAARPGNI